GSRQAIEVQHAPGCASVRARPPVVAVQLSLGLGMVGKVIIVLAIGAGKKPRAAQGAAPPGPTCRRATGHPARSRGTHRRRATGPNLSAAAGRNSAFVGGTVRLTGRVQGCPPAAGTAPHLPQASPRTNQMPVQIPMSQRATRAPDPDRGGGSLPQRLRVKVNVQVYEHEVEPRLLLVQYLRDVLGLTGTHVGCDTSHCGACTVLLDGEAVKSCTVLAVQADGGEVTTIEGLAQHGRLHPLQEAFWEHHGLQCGYCTPGMIMSALDLLNRHPDPDEETIRRGLEGNLCRCTGYQNIVRAVQAAAARMRAAEAAAAAGGGDD